MCSAGHRDRRAHDRAGHRSGQPRQDLGDRRDRWHRAHPGGTYLYEATASGTGYDIASKAKTAGRHDPPIPIHGDFLVSGLGYKVIVSGHPFEITGAASRYAPVDMLAPSDRARMQELLWQSSDGDAASEGGSFDGSFVSSANQAERYARRRREPGY